jgi:hypothetical protein
MPDAHDSIADAIQAEWNGDATAVCRYLTAHLPQAEREIATRHLRKFLKSTAPSENTLRLAEAWRYAKLLESLGVDREIARTEAMQHAGVRKDQGEAFDNARKGFRSEVKAVLDRWEDDLLNLKKNE